MSEVPAVQVPLPLKNWVKGTNGAMAVLSLGAGAMIAYLALPTIITLLTNTAIALGWLVVVGAIVGAGFLILPIIFHLWPKIRYQQKVWALAIAEQMVKRDPVRWSQIYIDDLKKKAQALLGAITQAVKSLMTAKRKRDENIKLRDDARAKAQAAYKAGNQAEAVRWERAAKRKDDAIARSERWIQMLELIVRALKKLSSTLETRIADQEDELKSYIDEYETAQQVEPGIRAGMNALAPDEDLRHIKESAIKEMTSKADGMYAELEMTMEAFQPIISAQDLDDAAAFERMSKAFAQWEKGVDSTLLGPGGKQQLIAETLDPMNILKIEGPRGEKIPVVKGTRGSFDDLIDR
ncbi:MAG: hypothetical protein WAV25_01615 [Minisyncoccia bacterium]